MSDQVYSINFTQIQQQTAIGSYPKQQKQFGKLKIKQIQSQDQHTSDSVKQQQEPKFQINVFSILYPPLNIKLIVLAQKIKSFKQIAEMIVRQFDKHVPSLIKPGDIGIIIADQHKLLENEFEQDIIQLLSRLVQQQLLKLSNNIPMLKISIKLTNHLQELKLISQLFKNQPKNNILAFSNVIIIRKQTGKLKVRYLSIGPETDENESKFLPFQINIEKLDKVSCFQFLTNSIHKIQQFTENNLFGVKLIFGDIFNQDDLDVFFDENQTEKAFLSELSKHVKPEQQNDEIVKRQSLQQFDEKEQVNLQSSQMKKSKTMAPNQTQNNQSDDEDDEFEDEFEDEFLVEIKTEKYQQYRFIKFDFQESKLLQYHQQNHKIINHYEIDQIESITHVSNILNEKKLKVNILNQVNDNFEMFFQSIREADCFLDQFKKIRHIILNKNSQILNKVLLLNQIQQIVMNSFHKKDLKRYSWLINPIDSKFNVMKNTQDQQKLFNIINKSKDPKRQILNLNMTKSIITLMKLNNKVLQIIQANQIVNVEQDNQDDRKIILILNNKQIKIIFSNIRQRIIFESSVFPLINSNLPNPFDQNVLLESRNKKLTLWCCTWNTGCIQPQSNTYEPILEGLEKFDILVFGFQETKINLWIDKITKSLQTHDLVNIVSMWQMSLCIFMKKDISGQVKNLQFGQKAMGIGNIIGNKGGVFISFKLFESSYCFIACHLAAKQHKTNLRRANYYNIIKHLRSGNKQLEQVFQFDYVFWMGDFNFRVDRIMELSNILDPFEEVNQMIRKNDFLQLLNNCCQFTQQRKNKEFFVDFDEPLIHFRPTYRRLRYDNKEYSNKKSQSPSWTDRIFHRCLPNNLLNILQYNSMENQLGSDHRPVFGLYEIEFKLPYVTEPKLFTQEIDEGIIEIQKILIEYDFIALNNALKFQEELELIPPFNIQLTFQANFLSYYTCTYHQQINNFDEIIQWQSPFIPKLLTVISNQDYLIDKNIFVIITVNSKDHNEYLIGQTVMDLRQIVEGDGETIIFEDNIKLFGCHFGRMLGYAKYDQD